MLPLGVSVRIRVGATFGVRFIFYVSFVSTKPTVLSLCITQYCYITGGVWLSFQISRSTGVSATTALKKPGSWML